MTKYVLIFLLAGLAGGIRYLISQCFTGIWSVVGLNLFGSFFLILLVQGYLKARAVDPDLTQAIQAGFFGSLTTMASPFLTLREQVLSGDYLGFALLAALHLLGGICFALLAQVLLEKGWFR